MGDLGQLISIPQLEDSWLEKAAYAKKMNVIFNLWI